MLRRCRLEHLAVTTLSVASLILVSSASAVTVELAPSKDNTLIETPEGNSNGAGDGIYVGRVGLLGDGTKRRGLLAFDLSSIPSGATIDAVTLSLQMAQSNDLGNRIVTVHRVSADWGEAGSLGSGSGGPAQTGDATWIFRSFNSEAWTTDGGDFVAVESGLQSVSGVGPYEWSSAGLVADVQFWLDNPASNFGWLLKDPETTMQTARKYYSRQGLVPPKLTINFTEVTDVSSGPSADAVWFAPPWPTPASGPVNLSYTLPRAARVSLSIHDAMGRAVRRLLVGDRMPTGRHTIGWDGRTDSGTQAAAGVYVASLVVDGDAYQRRIALLR